MSSREWMPLYWGSYHKKTQHLSTWQHGAYLLLLATYWTTGRAIARANARAIARANDSEMEQLELLLSDFFYMEKDGLLHNIRMDEEISKAHDLSEKRRRAGKKGAKASKAIARAIAPAKEGQLPPQLHSSKEETYVSIPIEVSMPFEIVFREYPAQRRGKKPDALRAFHAAFNLSGSADAQVFAEEIVKGIKKLKKMPVWTDDKGRWIHGMVSFFDSALWQVEDPKINDDPFAPGYNPIGAY